MAVRKMVVRKMLKRKIKNSCKIRSIKPKNYIFGKPGDNGTTTTEIEKEIIQKARYSNRFFFQINPNIMRLQPSTHLLFCIRNSIVFKISIVSNEQEDHLFVLAFRISIRSMLIRKFSLSSRMKFTLYSDMYRFVYFLGFEF